MKEEFCKERGLKPFKVCVGGPPATGKSFYARQIAEHYNITHVHAKKMIEEIVNWNKEKEEEIFRKREIKRKKKEIEEAAAEEERKKLEAEEAKGSKMSKKKSGEGEDDDDERDKSRLDKSGAEGEAKEEG